MENNLLHSGRGLHRSAIPALLALWLGGCAAVGAPGTGIAPAGPDDAFLANLVGRWDLARSIRGKEERNRVDVDWAIGHRYVRLHMLDAAEPPKYEAVVMIGYDPSEDRYVAHWTDSWGAQYSGVGYGKRVGDSVDFVFASPDGSRFHNAFTWNPEEKTWRARMESESAAGKRSFFAEDRLRRVP
jgi:hypothetical protein